MPFVKLDCGIIHSSLWAEDSDTKICWITLLLLADATGFVRAAASAIAREAGISAAVGRRALDLFSSPDDESRTPDNQGKRIEKVDGGYRILNYEKYRERDYTNAERQKRHRDKKKRNVTQALRNGEVTASNTCRSRCRSRKEEEGAKGSRPTSFSLEAWLSELEQSPTYRGINIRLEYGKLTHWCNVHGKQPTQRRFINWLNRSDKPLPNNGGASSKQTYGRNYLPPAREPTDDELQKAREIAKREADALREKLRA